MSSYRNIFKTTSIIGGTKVLTLAIGMVQTKVLAVLLGPGGTGQVALYNSIVSLVRSGVGLGIDKAGVRQIAEAAGKNDQGLLARTIQTLRMTSLASGIVGMLIVLLFCRPFARTTLGSEQYAGNVALISIILLFGGISAGQMALLQGMRQIRSLANCQILGAIFGAVASTALVYFYREKSIVWFLLAGAAFAILTSWWYARKVQVDRRRLPFRELTGEAKNLLSLGLAFVVAAVAGTASIYLSRIMVVRHMGLSASGLYSATITLSSLYVGIVLQAMSADFFPRVAGVAQDHPAVNRMVNEQTEIGILIALPGVLATLAFASLALRLFYSSAFLPATELIQWQLLGVALRVVSWPAGYIMVAQRKTRLFAASEIFFALFYVGLLWIGVRTLGLRGAGIAFMLMYAAYTVFVVLAGRRLTGFAWSAQAWQLVIISVAASGLVMTISRFLPPGPAMAINLALCIAAAVFSVVRLKSLLNISLRDVWQKIFRGPANAAA